MNNIRWIIMASIVIFVIMAWSVSNDKKVTLAADRYENCVYTQYGVSPANWYDTHGTYPTCSTEDIATQ